MVLVLSSNNALQLESPEPHGSASRWSYNFTLEWFAAVEVALLKGRHPLLADGNSPVQPSQVWNSNRKPMTGNVAKWPYPSHTTSQDFAQAEAYSSEMPHTGSENAVVQEEEQYSVDASQEVLERSSFNEQEVNDKDISVRTNGDQQDNEYDMEVESGQVLQAAETVMSVLDHTMPGTLADSEKEKVLDALGRGESIITAFQGAVPEDVREKIATAVAGAVQARGINLKLAGFGKSFPAPKIPEGMLESIQQKFGTAVNNEKVISPDSQHTPNPPKKVDNKEPQDTISVGDKNELQQDNREARKEADNEHTSDLEPSEKSGDEKENKDVEQREEESSLLKAGSDATVQPIENNVEHVETAIVGNEDQDGKDKGGMVQNTTPKTRNVEDEASNIPPPPPTIASNMHLGQALEALTGFDDSTQMAVTNIFGVFEGMLDQIEKENAGNSKAEESVTQVDQVLQGGEGNSGGRAEIIEMGVVSPHATNENLQVKPIGNKLETKVTDVDCLHAKGTGGVEKDICNDDDVSDSEDRILRLVEGQVNQTEKDKDISLDPEVMKQKQDKGSDSKLVALQQISSTVSGELVKQNNNQYKESTHLSTGGTSENHRHVPLNDVEVLSYPVEETSLKDIDSIEVHDYSTSSVVDTNGSSSHGSNQSSATAGMQTIRKARVVNALPLMDTTQEQKFLSFSQSSLPASHGFNDQRDDGCPSLGGLKGESNGSSTVEYQKSLELLHSEKVGHHRDVVEIEFSEEHQNEFYRGKANSQPNLVTDVVRNALKMEILRRVGASGLEALGLDVELEVAKVAQAAVEAVQLGKHRLLGSTTEVQDYNDQVNEGKLGVLHLDTVRNALGTVFSGNNLLVNLIPMGILVGVVLAALGAVYLIVADDQEDHKITPTSDSSFILDGSLHQANEPKMLVTANFGQTSKTAVVDSSSRRMSTSSEHVISAGSTGGLGVGMDNEKDEYSKETLNQERCHLRGLADAHNNREEETKPGDMNLENGVEHHGKSLVGAAMAAIGVSAIFTSKKGQERLSDKGLPSSEIDNIQTEEHKQNIVSDVAGKAMMIIPKREDGNVDHEKLVAMMADLGQKAGYLRLLGKVALLWGGLRGATSLTDRLLSFLHISERPLEQRLLGFAGMTVVLWTPVLVPLLPTLLQQWATKSSGGVADCAAAIGLYVAALILINIWGKRVRGFDKPLDSYGLSLLSQSKIELIAKGVALGSSLVAAFYATNAVLGYVYFTWTAFLVVNKSFSMAPVTVVLTTWNMARLVLQSLIMATAISIVEEGLFRGWLQEEIAVDLGFHRAVLLSALIFAVMHRSPPAMVGLWFLAVALSGARARTNGDLSFPVGIHAGIVATFSVLNVKGLVHYMPNSPTWFTGANFGNPLAGVLGTSMVAVLAVVMYPHHKQ